VARGSGKSWRIAEALIQLTVRYDLRILCLRRVQKSIDASSHKLLSDTIRRLGYESEFTITKTASRLNPVLNSGFGLSVEPRQH
jgi:phage terminase large subunit